MTNPNDQSNDSDNIIIQSPIDDDFEQTLPRQIAFSPAKSWHRRVISILAIGIAISLIFGIVFRDQISKFGQGPTIEPRIVLQVTSNVTFGTFSLNGQTVDKPFPYVTKIASYPVSVTLNVPNLFVRTCTARENDFYRSKGCYVQASKTRVRIGFYFTITDITGKSEQTVIPSTEDSSSDPTGLRDNIDQYFGQQIESYSIPIPVNTRYGLGFRPDETQIIAKSDGTRKIYLRKSRQDFSRKVYTPSATNSWSL
jgi:hypothetical protein